MSWLWLCERGRCDALWCRRWPCRPAARRRGRARGSPPSRRLCRRFFRLGRRREGRVAALTEGSGVEAHDPRRERRVHRRVELLRRPGAARERAAAHDDVVGRDAARPRPQHDRAIGAGPLDGARVPRRSGLGGQVAPQSGEALHPLSELQELCDLLFTSFFVTYTSSS